MCVANKMINGSQCTIGFYVDDNKISHKDPEVVHGIVRELESYFGKLTIESGPELDFLGMGITLTNDKKIEIRMKK